MAKYTNTVQYNLKTTLDSSGISKLQTEIRQMQSELKKMASYDLISPESVSKAQTQIKAVQQALSSSFNTKIGMLDISSFTDSLKNSKTDLMQIQNAFSQIGTKGNQSFNSLIGRVGQIDTGVKSISKTTDKIFNTIGNTVRWGVVASGFQTILNSVHEAVTYIKDLDTSLNNIRIVSEYSAEDMRKFSLHANEAAKALGQTTVAYTDASLIFAQQGYNLEDSERLADLTLKVANTTGQQTAEVSEQLTSWINGYKMTADEAQATMDKVTKVAAVGASDTEELMTAAAKVASTASTLGVTEDQLISQLSTIISVTREAPENVGNALKTIYARLGDLKMGKTLEDGVDLGKLTKRMQEVGVEVVNVNGEMTNMGEIIEQLMDQWQDLDTAQKQALSVELAGKYQYNRFMALMENQKMYEETLAESQDSEGFLERTQNIYMEGIQANLNSLKAAGESLITNLFDGNTLTPFLDGLTEALDLMTSFVQSIGGGTQALTLLGATATRVFSTQIASGINNMINNRLQAKQGQSNRDNALAALQNAGLNNVKSSNVNTQSLIDFTMDNLGRTSKMSTEQAEEYKRIRQQSIELANEQLRIEEKIKNNAIATNVAYKELYGSGNGDFISLSRDKNGALVQDNSNMIDAFRTDPDAMKLTQQDMDKLRGIYAQVSLEAQDASLAFDKMRNQMSTGIDFKTIQSTQEFTNELNIAEQRINALKNSFSSSGNEVKELTSLWNKLTAAMANPEDEQSIQRTMALLEELKRKMLEITTATDTSNKEISQMVQNNPASSFALEEEYNRARSQNESLRKEQQDFSASMNRQERINNIVDVAGALGQLIFAWNSFQQLGSLFLNDDLDIGERLEQILMNISITLPMLITGFTQLNQATGGLTFMQGARGLVSGNINLGIKEVKALTEEKIQLERRYTAISQQLSEKRRMQDKAEANNRMLAYRRYQREIDQLIVKEEQLRNAQKQNDTALQGGISRGQAFKGMIGSIGSMVAITVAIEAFAAWVNSTNQAYAELQEKENKRIETAKEQYTTTKEANDNYQELLKTYKETGTGIAELTEAGNQLEESLGLQGASAYTAAQQFDALGKKAQEAADKAKKSLYDANEAQLMGSWHSDAIGGFNSAGWGFNGSLAEDMSAGLDSFNTWRSNIDTQNYTYVATPESGAFDSTTFYETSGESLTDTSQYLQNIVGDIAKDMENAGTNVFAMEQIITEANDKLTAELANVEKELKHTSDPQRIQELNNYKNYISAGLADLEEIKKNESYVSGLEKYTEQFSLAAQDVQDKIQDMRNAQEIIDTYLSNDIEGYDSKYANLIMEQVDSMDQWLIAVNTFIENTNDGIAKTALTLERDYVTTGQQLYKILEEAFNQNLTTGKTPDGKTIVGNTKKLLEENNVEQEAVIDAAVKQFQDSIKNSGMTQGEQLKFLANIEFSAEGLAKAQKYLEEWSIDNPIELSADISDGSLRYTQEKLEEILKEANISEESFARRTEHKLSAEDLGYDDQTAKISEELKSRSENLRELERLEEGARTRGDTKRANELKKSLDEESKQVGILRERYYKVGEAAEQIAADHIELNNGVVELAENWEDAKNVLLDTSKAFSDAWFDAVDKVDGAVSKMLNIDPGTLSDEFYASAENMKLLERIFNEDTAALDELRKSASLDIVANIELDTSKMTDSLYDAMDVAKGDTSAFLEGYKNLWAQAMSEISAMKLNEGDFIDLDGSEVLSKWQNISNQLLAAGAYTAEEMTMALSSMGMEGEIVNVPAPVTQTAYTYEVTTHTTKVPNNFLGPLRGGESQRGATVTTATVTPIAGKPVTIQGTVPALKGLHYKGSGVTSISPSSFSKKSSSGGGGGGRKSSGGGSGRTYTPKTKDESKEESDRYERVNTQLESLGEDFEKIANEQDRLTGINMFNNMEKQIKLLEKQVKLYQQKLSIQKSEAELLRNELGSQYGIAFDGEGFISNYQDVFNRLQNERNSLVRQYNATTSEAGQDALEKRIEEADERFEEFKDKHSRYNELFSEIKTTENAIEDAINSMEDLQIEIFKTSVSAADSLKDLNEGLIEFKNNLNGLDRDKPFNKMMVASQKLAGYWKSSVADSNKVYDRLIGNAQKRIDSGELSPKDIQVQQNAIAMWQKAKGNAAKEILDSGGFGNFDVNADLVNSMVAEINKFESTGRSDVFGENEAALYETAKEVWEQAADELDNYVSNLEELRDAINEEIDEIFDKIERRLEIYEQIDEELEHQQSIVEMLFGEKAFDKLNMIADVRIQANTQAIEFREQLVEQLKAEQSIFEENSEEWLKYQDQIIAREKEIQEAGMQILEDQIANRDRDIEKLLDKAFNEALGVDDLDWMAEQWELINRNADQYLDSVNSAYELQKLQNQALKLMDNSTGVRQQEMINQFMKDNIEQLKTKDKLSQYDVAYAQAQLEILEKRLALEEAARNKSQMKLKRDTQGNYRYVYTNNPEEQLSAEEDLLDAQNNAYNVSKDAMVQSQQDVLSAVQDAKAALMNIWNDANLSVSEKVERMKWYVSNLQEYLQNAGDVLNESQMNIINDFLAMTELTTEVSSDKLAGIRDDILEGNTDMFNQIDERWEQNYFDITGLLDNFEEYFDETGQALEEILRDFEYQVEDTSNLVGGYFYETEAALGSVVGKLNELTSTQANFINQLKNDAGIVMDYQNTLSVYEQKITNLEGAMRQYAETVERLQALVASKEAEITQLRAMQTTTPTYSSGGGGNNGITAGMSVQLKPGAWYHYRSDGTGPSGNWSDAVKITHTNWGSAYPIHLGTENATLEGGSGSGWRGWVRPEDLIFYDTGGYTGNWSNSDALIDNGKLAVLHQKELVLNKEDTANLLAAIQENRKLVEELNEQRVHGLYNTYQEKVRDLTRQVEQYNENVRSRTESAISQDVHITAEFPGVNRAEEIEEALLSLNDRALQYAGAINAYDSYRNILGRIL